MNLYFDLIPKELRYEILSYLSVENLQSDVVELILKKKLNYEKIDYETLFSLKFNYDYTLMKKVMIHDKNLDVYNDSWKIFYHDFHKIALKYLVRDLKTSNTINEDMFFQVCSATLEVLYSAKLFEEYPGIYKYKHKYKSNLFVILLYITICHCDGKLFSSYMIYRGKILPDLVKNNGITEKISYKELLGSDKITLFDLTILIFILYGDPNFEITPEELENFSEILNNDTDGTIFYGFYIMISDEALSQYT